MVKVLYFLALLFYFCNGQYLQQIKPVNYPEVNGFRGGNGFGYRGPGLGSFGNGNLGFANPGFGVPSPVIPGHSVPGSAIPTHPTHGIGVPEPVSSELGGLDINARGIGGQRAEGVVQAQPDITISSLPQSRILHKAQKPPSSLKGNYFEQEFLKFQPFKQVDGHKARQSPINPYGGNPIAPGGFPGRNYLNLPQGNGVHPGPISPYGGGGISSGVSAGPYSGVTPGVFPAGQVFPNPYSGINPTVVPGGELFPEVATGVTPSGLTKEDLATGLYSGGLLKEDFFNMPQQNPGLIPARFSDNFPLVPSQVQVQRKNKSDNTIKTGQSLGVRNLNSNKTGSLPKFLEGADQEVVNKFKKILRQPQVPYSEKLKQVEDLVSGLDENRQKLFRQFIEESKVIENQRKIKNNQNVRSSTKNGFEEISSILDNQSLPEKERWDQVVDVYRRLEPKIQGVNEHQK